MTGSVPESLVGILDLYERSSHVRGWFDPLDAVTFAVVSTMQAAAETHGDILEIGAYEGRSSILLGALLQPGETLIVSDLFGDDAPTSFNAAENNQHYKGLALSTFVRNYRIFHAEPPVVLQGASRTLVDRVAKESCRLIHIDGSHRYGEVTGDVASTRLMSGSGGIVAFDDIRTEYSPGVASAVWPAVVRDGLIPLLLTRQKLFATWDPAFAHAAEALAARLRSSPGISDVHLIDEIAGHPVFHAVADESLNRLRRHGGLKSRVRDYIPPAMYRAVSRARRGRTGRS